MGKLRLLLLPLLLVPASAESVTLRVPSEYPTINEALDASSPGDTVLVAPGTYTDFETRPGSVGPVSAVAFLKGGVTLRSAEGPTVTEMRLEETVGWPHTVYAYRFTPGGPMNVEGFAISGTLDGMSVVSSADNAQTITIEDCLFEREGLAGAAVAGTRTHMEVRDCEFRGYPTGVSHNDERLVVEDCVFEDGGRSISCDDGFDENYMSLTVRRCEFRNNTGWSGGAAGVGCSFYDLIIVEDCLFQDCGGSDGYGGISAVAAPGGSISVRGCTFVRDYLTGGRRGAGAVLDGQAVEVIGNTFHQCTQQFATPGGAALYIRHQYAQGEYTFLNNVVVECETVGSGGPPVAVGHGGTGFSSCNVFWNNPGGTVAGLVSTPSDFISDPQFCDPENGDFTVAASSPCVPGNWIDPCGQIGAHGAGCPAGSGVLTGVTTVPLGLDITVDGSPTRSTCLFAWDPGSVHSVTVPEVVGEGLGRRYELAAWLDGPTDSSRSIATPSVPTLYTAAYDSLFYLTTGVADPDEGSVTPESGYREPFEPLSVIAAAESSYFYFKNWVAQGDGSYNGPDSIAPIVMNGPITQIAYFTKNTDVTIATDPPAFTVFVDAEAYTAPVAFVWQRDTQHHIEVSGFIHETGSLTRYWFDSWSDGRARGHFITTPHDPATFTASFRTEHFLSFETAGEGSATPADGWQGEGEIVGIEAISNPYYLFTDWLGTGPGSYTGPDNPATVTIDGPIHQEAHFRRMAQEVTLSLSNTDPFVHSGPPLGFGNVYLWYICATEGGFSGLDGELAGTMMPLAFLPEPGIFNGGSGSLLEITATECQSGPTLLGAILVQDDAGGELSLVPRSDTGFLRTHDCSALPFEWPLDLKITNVRTDGGAVGSSGRGCEEDVPTPVAEVSVPLPLPQSLSLSAPRPNPLHRGGRSRFEFALPGPTTVRLAVYDVTGRQVAARRPEIYPSGGAYTIDWDPGLRSSGVYYVRLTTDAGQAVGTRWVLVR
jgi:hypothetical protein